MKVYEGTHIKDNLYFVQGEFGQLQVDSVVPVQINDGEIVYAIVVTRTGGGAVVKV